MALRCNIAGMQDVPRGPTWPMQTVSTIDITGSAKGIVSAGIMKAAICRSLSSFHSSE